MAEKQSLFRKKSTEYLDSPEKLDQYLHVTNPGVWAILITIIVLLAGVCVWGVFGRIETHCNVAIVTENGQTTCLVPQSDLDAVIDNPVVSIEGKDYKLVPDTPKAAVVSESTNVYARIAGDLEEGDVYYTIPVEGQLEDGILKGSITTETLSPFSLLMN